MKLLHIETSTEQTQNKEKLKPRRKRNCQKSQSTQNEKEQIHHVIGKKKHSKCILKKNTPITYVSNKLI